jgi:hypothetical protein
MTLTRVTSSGEKQLTYCMSWRLNLGRGTLTSQESVRALPCCLSAGCITVCSKGVVGPARYNRLHLLAK